MPELQKDIINKLQQEILQWDGYKPPATGHQSLVGLGPLESAFPNGTFPVAAVHELVCGSGEQAAASVGLVTGILSVLMRSSSPNY
jgi:protein ImuA